MVWQHSRHRTGSAPKVPKGAWKRGQRSLQGCAAHFKASTILVGCETNGGKGEGPYFGHRALQVPKEPKKIISKPFFSEVFSKNRRRKRPNLSFESLEQVVEKVTEKEENYDMEGDQDLVRESDGTFDHQR